MRGSGPAFPESRRSGLLAPGFRGIFDPDQLQHEIPKEEAAAGRALTGMLVWRSLGTTKLPQPLGRWSAGGGAYENMIEPHGHNSDLRLAEVSGSSTVRAKGVRLEVQLQSQLYLSGRVCLSGHFAECRGSDGQIR